MNESNARLRGWNPLGRHNLSPLRGTARNRTGIAGVTSRRLAVSRPPLERPRQESNPDLVGRNHTPCPLGHEDLSGDDGIRTRNLRRDRPVL